VSLLLISLIIFAAELRTCRSATSPLDLHRRAHHPRRQARPHHLHLNLAAQRDVVSTLVLTRTLARPGSRWSAVLAPAPPCLELPRRHSRRQARSESLFAQPTLLGSMRVVERVMLVQALSSASSPPMRFHWSTTAAGGVNAGTLCLTPGPACQPLCTHGNGFQLLFCFSENV
jgi:hypothetical protein